MAGVTRREFQKTAIALGVSTALGSMRVLGANERIGVGLIGCGGRGRQLWEQFLKESDARPVAVCDVYEPFRAASARLAGGVAADIDFRRLLDRRDVDAVIVATPDHWHALQTVMACQAGKDVLVEKPLSLTVREGRVMIDAARRHERIVQTGSQQRSGTHYASAVRLIHEGAIGPVHRIAAGFVRNAMPGFVARELQSGLTKELDWDLWLGPAPHVPFDPFRCIYHFRWFWDYSGGQMTNWGAHHLDIARWALAAKGPLAVAGFGGRFGLRDGGETPDVQEVLFQFPGCVVSWTGREVNRHQNEGLSFHGTKGTLSITRSGFTVTPEVWTGQDPANPDAKNTEPAMPSMEEKGGDLNELHVRNFLDCVRTRKRPNADVEEGHLSAAMCHLGNIATRLGRSVKWDPESERIAGDDEANRWLTKAYRRPWRLENSE